MARKWLLAAVLAVLWPVLAQAQPWPPAGPVTGKEQIPCTQTTASGTATKGCSPGQIGGVANNAGLAATPAQVPGPPITYGLSTWRFGVANAGDVPPQAFYSAPGPCVPAAGDVGSCVKATAGGVWIAKPAGPGETLDEWTGAAPTADVTATANQAIISLQGKFAPLLIDGQFPIGSPGVVDAVMVPIVGTDFAADDQTPTGGNSQFNCTPFTLTPSNTGACLTMGANTASNHTTWVQNISIWGTIPAPGPITGSIGLKVLGGFNTYAKAVNVRGFDMCFDFTVQGGNGLSYWAQDLTAGSCKTSYLVLDTAREAHFYHLRFGDHACIGTGCTGFAERDVITFRNGPYPPDPNNLPPGNAGPNTINIGDFQFNNVQTLPITCIFCFRGPPPATGAYGEFKAWQGHIEYAAVQPDQYGYGPGVILTDNQVTILASFSLADTNIAESGNANALPVFTISPFTQLTNMTIHHLLTGGLQTSAVCLFCLDANLLNKVTIDDSINIASAQYVSEQGNYTATITGGTCAGPYPIPTGPCDIMNVTALGVNGPRIGAQVFFAGLACVSNCGQNTAVYNKPQIAADSTTPNACGGSNCTGTAGSALTGPGSTGTYVLTTGGDTPATGLAVAQNNGYGHTVADPNTLIPLTNTLTSIGNVHQGNLTIAGHWDGCLTINDTVYGTITDTATGCVRWSSPPELFTPNLLCGGTPCGVYAASGRQGYVARDGNGGFWVGVYLVLSSLTGTPSGVVTITGVPPNFVCATAAQWAGGSQSAATQGGGVNLRGAINLQPVLSGVINLTQPDANSGSMANNNTALQASFLAPNFSIAGQVHCLAAAA